MLTLDIVFVTLLGLAFGSFLNVCISRLPRHESIVRPPSRCPRCQAPIPARDNVPLLSFFLLGGRCRHCGWRIPWRYPLVETATAMLAVANLLIFGPGVNAVAFTLFCSLLLALAVCDAETMLLPDTLTLTLLASGLIYHVLDGWLSGRHLGPMGAWRRALLMGLRGALSAAAAAAALWLIGWIYARLRHQQGLGLGDVKLAAGIAAWLGARQMALAFFLAVMGGAIAGMTLYVLRRRRGALSNQPLAVPFGVFLTLAGIYCVFAGPATLGWYLSLFPS